MRTQQYNEYTSHLASKKQNAAVVQSCCLTHAPSMLERRVMSPLCLT